jgi:nitroreductase
MEKPANADYPIHELLAKRWSPRVFADRAVETEKLRSMLEAARWAPSSFNEQPWSFILATKDQSEDFDRLAGCLVESNAWARGAPLLMLSVAKLRFDRNDRENRHAWHDVGQAVACMTVQATALGLRVHQMAGFDAEKARASLEIPKSHDPVAMIAVGYPADPANLTSDQREREMAPRRRRRIIEFVYGGLWGRRPKALFENDAPA